jgi:hypothetical protein
MENYRCRLFPKKMVIFLKNFTLKYVQRLGVNLNKLPQLTEKHRHLVGLTLGPDIHYKLSKALL